MSDRDDETAQIIAKAVMRIVLSKKISYDKKVKELENIKKLIEKLEDGKE